MAKSTPSTTSPFAHLRDLFTATEKKILDSSFGTALTDEARRRAGVGSQQPQ